MTEAAPKEDDLYNIDLPVGEILRRTRNYYGRSLKDVEQALRIRSSQIEAIEEGDVDKLPGRVYAIGFVRSYSEYLGLDGNKMVHLFKTQVGRQAHNPQLHFPVTAADTKVPPLWLIAASVLGTVIIAALWLSFQETDRSVVVQPPSVAQAMEGIDKPESVIINTQATGDDLVEGVAASDADNGVAQGVASAQEQSIILNIKQNSWVEIKDDQDNMLVSRVLKAGESYFIPSRSDLSMSLGNAAGVQLEVDGKVLGALGAEGEVRRDIPMNVETLFNRYGISTQKALQTQPAEN